MNILTRIALKYTLIGLCATLIGSVAWRLLYGAWPHFISLGAAGAVLSLSIAWAVKEAHAVGYQEGQQGQGDPGAPSG